jgi:hypothetical protein
VYYIVYFMLRISACDVQIINYIFDTDMDIKNAPKSKMSLYKEKYEYNGSNKYDYAANGVLTKTLPKILFKGNSLFVTFLQLIDLRIINLLKYIDELKNFKSV